MFVSDLIKSGVISVTPGTTLADATQIMVKRHVSGLPVVEQGQLVGIVTQGDLLRRAEIGTDDKKHGWFKSFFMPCSMAHEYVETHGRYVRDVMTAPVFSVYPDTPLAEVANIMREQHVKRLPVIQEGKLAGIISRTDLLTVLAQRLTDTAAPLTENEIKDRILKKLKEISWAPKFRVTVAVKDGVVDLDGVVFNDAERQAVRVIAEITPGVKEVRDHRVFVDPSTGESFLNPWP